MLQYLFRSCLILLLFAVSLSAQGRDALIQSVNSSPGWTSTGPATVLDEPEKARPDRHWQFSPYGLLGMTAQEWQGPAGRIKATLFQFTDAGAAYSFFTISRKLGGPHTSAFAAGGESFQASQSRYFWQSGYVVRLEGDERAAQDLAKILSQGILGRSLRPALVNRLPAADLRPGSEIYLLDSANFQKTEGMDPVTAGYELSAEAAAADYPLNGKTVHLLLMLYPTQQIAKKFTEELNQATPQLAASRKRIGPLLAIVSGTADADALAGVLGQVHYQSSVTWSEPQPGLGLGPIIVTVFTFIGLLAAVCILGGFGFGGVRFFSKRLFPNRLPNREKSSEVIQLKLDQ